MAKDMKCSGKMGMKKGLPKKLDDVPSKMDGPKKTGAVRSTTKNAKY